MTSLTIDKNVASLDDPLEFQKLLSVFSKSLPKNPMDIIEWLEENIYLTASNAHEVGRYRVDRTPYLKDVFKSFANDDVKEIVLVTGTQMGKTTLTIGSALYSLAERPRPLLFAFPNEKLASSFMRMRVDPIVNMSEELQKIFPNSEIQNKKNAGTLSRMVNGVPFEAIGMGRIANTVSRPMGICIVDEIDQVKDNEKFQIMGSLRKRIDTYRDGAAKFLLTSTPSVKGNSPIWARYLQGDQRRCHVPCLKCKHYQLLDFSRLMFPKGEKVYFFCKRCKHRHYEKDKPFMIEKCKWIPEGVFNKTTRIVSYQISKLYSPFVTWEEVAKEQIDAKEGDWITQKDFINNTKAEVWDHALSGVSIKPKGIMAKLEERGKDWDIPSWGRILIGAVDVQDDRLEGEFIAFGSDYQRYHVEYFILYGTPYKPALWEALNVKLQQKYRKQGSSHLVSANIVFIDSGHGLHTKNVFRFCKEYQEIYPDGRLSKRWYPIKGSSKMTMSHTELVQKKHHPQYNVRYYHVNTHQAKRMVYDSLVNNLNNGKTHFPKKPCYNKAYFNGLCSEIYEKKKGKYGQAVYEWTLKNGQVRNEPLDIGGYIEAAAHEVSGVFLGKTERRQRTSSKVIVHDKGIE